MKRSLKNILMILFVFLLLGGVYFTMDYAKNNLKDNNTFSNKNQNMGNNSFMTPDDKNAPSDNMTPPDNNGNNTSGDNKMTPPDDKNSSNEKENNPSSSETTDNNESSQNNGNIPDKKDDTNVNGNDSSNQNTPPNDLGSMGKDVFSKENSTTKLTTVYYCVFGLEAFLISITVIYLIMSKANKLSFKETLSTSDKKIIYLLATLLTSIVLVGGMVFVTNQYFLASTISSNTKQNGNQTSNESSIETIGNVVVEDEKTLTDTYTSTTSDESAILVKNGGNLTLEDADITKSGDTTNTEESEFYGINAGILVTKASTATIKNINITTSAKGSNAVFSTGEDSKITISNSTITTTGSSSSRGLDATYGGEIIANNVNIKTSGASSATLATDRGEGCVTVTDSKLETNGKGSPLIYSTGLISVTNTKGVANNSQMVVVEGKNSASILNSTLSASGAGNRNNVDNAGVMIYQSASGDASNGTGNFTSKNSILEILKDSKYYQTAPMFFVTNTSAIINLENTNLIFGSNILLNIGKTSEWGNNGSNGGVVTLNAKNQKLAGNILVDSISTLTLNLEDSTYEGAINSGNKAKSISVSLDRDSTITLTADSYITSLNDSDSSYSNINFNGYKLYVNGKAINE